MRNTPMPPRKKRLGSRSPIKQGGTPIRPKKRKPSEFARIYGSKARVEFVKSLPCFECGDYAGQMFNGETLTIANAHTKNGGKSRKGDYTTIVPLCEATNGLGCHNAQHRHGWSVLWTLDTLEKREAAAALTESRWQNYVAAHLSHHGADHE